MLVPYGRLHRNGGIVKKILQKNQVIITALVLMIAVAGYLRFTNDNVKGVKDYANNSAVTASPQTDAKDASSSDVLNNELYEDVGSSELLEVTDELAEASPAVDGEKQTGDAALNENADQEFADLSAQDLGEDSIGVADNGELQTVSEGQETPGDAVLVSNTINSDFFSSQKVLREQTRAKNKETLMNIVNNANITEDQKQSAIQGVVDMTEIVEKERAAEMLLEAKGFHEVVVSIVDGGVDVLVDASNLTEQQMAQVEDIVKRKTGIDAKNIVITPVGVVEK